MANNKTPLSVKLPADARKRLEEAGTTLEDAKRYIEFLKELDLDTTVLDEKLAWADKTRNTLLRHFK